MTPQPPDVREQVERIAGSAMFAESERLRRFLRFTVESKLRGEPERIKEYVLGREVFDRRDGYDPRLDPIVRVEARRLRSKLSEYYSGPGRAESVRIVYPKGSYIPVFVGAASPPAQTVLRNPRLFAAAALGLFILGLIGAYAYRSVSAQRSGMLAVLPAQWLWPSDRGVDPSAIGLSEALDAELANRDFARVIAWPVIDANHNTMRSSVDAAKRFGASKLIAVSVRRMEGGELTAIFLIDPVTGEKLRAEHYFTSGSMSYWIHTELAARIANDLHNSGRL